MFKKVFIILFIAVFFAIPFFSFASHAGEIVPCGAGELGHDPCNTCHAFQLVHNVIQFGFLFILLPATAIAFLIGGVLMLTAGGNETQVTRAKSILWNTIIGILIAFASFVIINTIIATLASGKINGKAWYEFPGCSGGGSPIDRASSGSSGSSGLITSITQESFQVAGAATQSMALAQAASWVARVHDVLRAEDVVGRTEDTDFFLKNFIESAEAMTPLAIMAQQANYFAEQAITLADSVRVTSANAISLQIASEAQSIAWSSRRSGFSQSHSKLSWSFVNPAFAVSPVNYPGHMTSAVRAVSSSVIARIMEEYYINNSNGEDIAVVEDIADRLFGALLIYMRGVSYDPNDGSSVISLRMLSAEIMNFLEIDFREISKSGSGPNTDYDTGGGAAWGGFTSIQNGIPDSIVAGVRMLFSLGGDGGGVDGGSVGDDPGGAPEGGIGVGEDPGAAPEGGIVGEDPGAAPEGGIVGEDPGGAPADGIGVGEDPGGAPEGGIVGEDPGAAPESGFTGSLSLSATIASNVVASINNPDLFSLNPGFIDTDPDAEDPNLADPDSNPNPATTISPSPASIAQTAVDIAQSAQAMASFAANNPNAPNASNVAAGANVAINTAIAMANDVLGQPETVSDSGKADVVTDSHAVAGLAIDIANTASATLAGAGLLSR